MKTKTKNYLVVLIITVLGLLFQLKYINEFPSHIHAWAQSDRYALSLGFVENNLNLFKPQTFVLNHQFPDNWKTPTKYSLTAVDFPIHDYIPAVFMKISGTHSVWIFRLYILLYSFIGLFFLFKLCYLQTNDFIKSIFVVLFAATSPVFVYYQGGFLPTIPSLSNAVIGIYFYLKYLKQNNQKDFWLAIAFLTLATLSRTTFAIILIAVFGLEFLKLIRGKDKLRHKLFPVAFSVSIIIIYQLYNAYLRKTYGSIFLNHILPATSFKEAKEIINIAYTNWSTQYFSKIHYLIIIGGLISALYFIFKKKINITHVTGQLWLLILIIFVGYLAFAVLMLKQFPAHDYYFLDTFFFPIVLLLIAIISYIPKFDFKHSGLYIPGIVFLLSIPLVVNAVHSQKQRRNTGYWDKTTTTITNFKNSDAFLDSLNIKQNARILVLDACAPNIPFILMNRKGYAVMSTSKENIQAALRWDYDYLIIQDAYFISDIYAEYPEIISTIKKIADNGKISVCTLVKEKSKQSLLEFLQLNDKIPVFEQTITFDTVADQHWQNTQSTSKLYHSAPNSAYITQEMTYGICYKTSELKAITEKNRTLLFSAYLYKNTLNDCEIVASVSSKGQNVYYMSYNLKDLLKKSHSWEKADVVFQIPHIDDDNYEFAVYILNSGRNNFNVDDVSLKLF
jgi:hypothetical protein